MHQCNGGLICYQKSDKPRDGMCVPECRNGRHIDYKKIIWYKENPKKESNGTLLRDDQLPYVPSILGQVDLYSGTFYRTQGLLCTDFTYS